MSGCTPWCRTQFQQTWQVILLPICSVPLEAPLGHLHHTLEYCPCLLGHYRLPFRHLRNTLRLLRQTLNVHPNPLPKPSPILKQIFTLAPRKGWEEAQKAKQDPQKGEAQKRLGRGPKAQPGEGFGSSERSWRGFGEVLKGLEKVSKGFGEVLERFLVAGKGL